MIVKIVNVKNDIFDDDARYGSSTKTFANNKGIGETLCRRHLSLFIKLFFRSDFSNPNFLSVIFQQYTESGLSMHSSETACANPVNATLGKIPLCVLKSPYATACLYFQWSSINTMVFVITILNDVVPDFLNYR